MENKDTYLLLGFGSGSDELNLTRERRRGYNGNKAKCFVVEE